MYSHHSGFLSQNLQQKSRVMGLETLNATRFRCACLHEGDVVLSFPLL